MTAVSELGINQHARPDAVVSTFQEKIEQPADLQYGTGRLVLHFMHEVSQLLHPLSHNTKLEQQAIEGGLSILVAAFVQSTGGPPYRDCKQFHTVSDHGVLCMWTRRIVYVFTGSAG